MLHPINVTIKNFQSISELDFEIYGFTCITGKSNIGKSSIVRAISGALINAPVGGAIRKGAKYCSVSLQSTDWGFIWEKGAGVNRYHLRDKDKPLDKVGAGQIDQIANLGFQSVKVGSDKVIYPWLASQFEPLFLINQSGPAITDFISEVSRLETLQDAIIINTRNKRRFLEEAKVKTENLDKIRQKEQTLSDLDQLLVVRDELDAQAFSIQQYEDQISNGKILSDKIFDNADKIDRLSKVESVKVPETIEGFIELQAIYDHWMKLEKAAKNVIGIRGILAVLVPSVPEELEQIQNLATVETLANSIEFLQASVEILSQPVPVPDPEEMPPELLTGWSILTRLEQLKAEETGFRKQLTSIEAELAEVKEQIDAIPVCPTCSRPVILSHSHV